MTECRAYILTVNNKVKCPANAVGFAFGKKMKDNILGELEVDENLPNVLNGVRSYLGRDIKLIVDPDNSPANEALALAREGVVVLAQLDSAAKHAACKHLLDTYNDYWREYKESDGKGGWNTVSNDLLSEDEFISGIKLVTFQVEGGDSICLWYNDGGLFGGHAILVSSNDGRKFEELDIALWG